MNVFLKEKVFGGESRFVVVNWDNVLYATDQSDGAHLHFTDGSSLTVSSTVSELALMTDYSDLKSISDNLGVLAETLEKKGES